MVRWCVRLTRLTFVCEVVPLGSKSDKISKTPFGLADRNRLALFRHVSFSSSLRTFFLSQNKMECLLFSAVCEGCDVVFASPMDPWIWSGE